jgi:hypothetical protein
VGERRFTSNSNTRRNEDDADILKTQWQDFFQSFMNPITVFLFVGAFLLVLVQSRLCVSWSSAALTLLIGLMAGVGINRFEKVYSEYHDKRQKIRRGIIAIRRLGTLIEDIRLLESKIDRYQSDIESQKRLYRKELNAQLDELKNESLSLQLVGFSCIEDWTDILPDANIANLHAQVIGKFLHDREMAMDELRELSDAIKLKGDQAVEDKNKLEVRIKVKEQELAMLNDLLFNTTTTGLWTTMSVEPTELSLDTEVAMYVAQCSVCGQSYYKSTRNPDPHGRCTRCVSEGKMPVAAKS